MGRWIRLGIVSFSILSAAYIGLMWVGTGGLEQFQPPFEIVLPQNLHGVVCVTSRPGTTEDVKRVVRHEATSEGLLEVDGEIYRSHRPVKLYVRNAETGQLNEIPATMLLSSYTESDPKTGEWYAVRWLGTPEDWDAFQNRSGIYGHLCLGRFNSKVAK
jgi:hypothetical protein